MENCLVTKLKTSVTNDNLVPLDGIVFNVVSASAATGRSIRVYAARGEKVTAKVWSGTTYFTDSAGTANYGTEHEYTINNNGFADIYVSNSAGTFVVFGKYCLGYFLSYASGAFTVKAESLAYFGASNSSTTLSIDGITIAGNVSAMKNDKPYARIICGEGTYGNVTGIKLELANAIYGDFESSELYGQLTISPACKGILRLRGSKVTIVPEEFAAAQCTSLYCDGNTAVSGNISNYVNTESVYYKFNGTKTTGTAEEFFETVLAKQTEAGTYKNVTLVMSDYSTFHGAANQNGVIASFAENSITVTIRDVVRGTYDGSTWTYS